MENTASYEEVMAALPAGVREYVVEKRAAHVEHRKQLDRPLSGDRVLVAYFDVLGFAPHTRTHEAAAQLYVDYQMALGASAQSTHEAQVAKGEKGWGHPFDRLLRPVVFSDSTFLVTTEISEEASRQIQQAVSEMVGIYMLKGLPVRGAIVAGDVWWDPRNDVRLGPGITEAYVLAESFDVVGIGIRDDVPAPNGPRFTFARKDPKTRAALEAMTLRVPVRTVKPEQYDWDAIYSGAMAMFHAAANAAPEADKPKYARGQDIMGAILAG